MAEFRRGVQPKGTFEFDLLPDSEKERLCRALLSEFGVTQVRPSNNGELIHSCCLPNGAHKNGDASPSASLNFHKLTYNCYGCGSSGGLLWFIATCREEDGDSARRWLEDQTGSGADEQSLVSLLQFIDAVYSPKSHQVMTPIPKMSESVLTPWLAIHPYLTDPPQWGSDGQNVGGRGISEQSIMRFKVGYAPRYRTRVGEDAAGKPLFIESPRIVLPHFWKGNLVGWQTRRLLKDGTPKYVSSPDFPKDGTLYSYNPKAKEAVVVESPMSVLACADDVPHMEATFGAKLTDRQHRLLTMHRRLILWLDNDEAGWTSTDRIAEMTSDYSDVWVVNSPWVEDAGDLPSEERLRLLSDPVPYALWRRPRVLDRYCDRVSA